MLLGQRLVPRVPPLLLSAGIRAIGNERLVRWSFNHYLNIAHPSFAHAVTPQSRRARAELAEAA